MSQITPPQLEGQIDSPNPLELFWDNNKRLIIACLVAAVLALGVNYVIQYVERQENDAVWSALATSTGLDQGYATDGNWAWLFQQAPQMARTYYPATASELISDVGKDLKAVDLKTMPAELQGTAAEPLWIWFAAQKAVEEEEWDRAEQRLQELESQFPDHFLCAASDYPVQRRAEIPKDDEKNDEKNGESDSPPDPDEKPELVPAAPGSAVSLLRRQIAEQLSFRAGHERFFVPREPTSDWAAVFDFEQNGESLGKVKIRFFADVASEHVAKIKVLIEEGFWNEQRVHEIRRGGTQNMLGRMAPSELRFGWPSSKSEDESEWKAADEIAEEHVLDWEGRDAGLSHFPGTVAVEPYKDGKSQVERIVINADEMGGQADGGRVIVGRVVEGLDVIRQIVLDTGFPSDTDEQRGQGRPADRITIRSIAIE